MKTRVQSVANVELFNNVVSIRVYCASSEEGTELFKQITAAIDAPAEFVNGDRGGPCIIEFEHLAEPHQWQPGD